MFGDQRRLCPAVTAHAASPQEMQQSSVELIKAYKLGRNRWSYNQIELLLLESETGEEFPRQLTVTHTTGMTCTADTGSEGTEGDEDLSFLVTFCNDVELTATFYLVYDKPEQAQPGVYQW